MADESPDDDGTAKVTVVSFPYSRLAPPYTIDPDAPVAYGKLASLIGIPREQTTGHWCSYCGKIWYGYMLEVACPMCGNRHG